MVRLLRITHFLIGSILLIGCNASLIRNSSSLVATSLDADQSINSVSEVYSNDNTTEDVYSSTTNLTVNTAAMGLQDGDLMVFTVFLIRDTLYGDPLVSLSAAAGWTTLVSASKSYSGPDVAYVATFYKTYDSADGMAHSFLLTLASQCSMLPPPMGMVCSEDATMKLRSFRAFRGVDSTSLIVDSTHGDADDASQNVTVDGLGGMVLSWYFGLDSGNLSIIQGPADYTTEVESNNTGAFEYLIARKSFTSSESSSSLAASADANLSANHFSLVGVSIRSLSE